MKSSFKVCASATPNQVDRTIEDWWLVTSLQETHITRIVFIVLTTWPQRFKSVFEQPKTTHLLSKHKFRSHEVCSSWHDITASSRTQAFFIQLLINLIALGWSMNFVAWFLVKKWQNQKIIFVILIYALCRFQNDKNPVCCIHDTLKLN